MTTMKSRRGLLLGTSLFAGMAVASAASAQTASPPAANTLQEIVVTGSRIPRPNLEQATPVAVVSQTVIQQAGPQNLGDVIAELPAVGPTNTIRANSNNFANSAGVSSVDLRNLGTSRTLVLVDGQRHVNGDLGSNAVDLNSIPTALVDRVEITTGGASAIYGSDAVSGVVNIILKKRFEGFQFDAQGGGYDEGFGQKYSASFTAGRTFLDDRLNVAVTGFWHNEAGVDARNLPKAHNFGTIVNPADLAGPVDPTFRTSPSPIRNDNIPDRIFVPNIGSELVTENGAIFDTNNLPTLTTVVSFDSHGNPIPVPLRTGFNSSAFGQLAANCGDCFFPEDFEQETSPNKGGGADVRLNFDWTPHLHANLDAKFVQNNVSNVIQPSFTFGDFLILPDNAFITPAIRTALETNVPGFETFDDLAILGEFLNGSRSQDIRRRTDRVVGGLNGDFDAGFAQINWDGELNYGRSENRFTNSGLRITANFDAAIDSVVDPATGQPACRINVPSAGPPQEANDETSAASGCVPFNPFGPLANNGASAFAYSFGTFGTKDTLSQEVASLNANFDSSRFFNLQGGPVGVAVGAEYRMERTKEVNDPALVAGLTENLSADSSGGYNVKEAYVEVNLPVFKDFRPFIQELSLDAAFRGANYSTVGSVSAYKFSGTYAPVS
ncbi:MAG TPA: TonB-dependent receptor plug domain-containing protein, partial [Caulobacteraceae bacterium]|nr:TonB-dependent receptor plug domain-containing protein [Caulobacteraceae bacterium]